MTDLDALRGSLTLKIRAVTWTVTECENWLSDLKGPTVYQKLVKERGNQR